MPALRPPPRRPPSRLGLRWEDVCRMPSLRNLAYKIETNEYGQIIMSPTRLLHGAFQSEIARLLSQHAPPGRTVIEAAVRTSKGTKVPDVGWFSVARWATVRDEFEASLAPEICVEVLSPTNAPREMAHKRKLYFAAGADEVWVCDAAGVLTFFLPDGPVAASPKVPVFPAQIDV